jgi:hypothetical protein
MSRTTRLLAVIPVFFGLVWLAAYALEAGAADSAVFEGALTLREWSGSRLQLPANEGLMGVRDDLLRARAISPRNPAVHELLGLIAARSSERQEYLKEAGIHFVKAIELRPTSPYTWGNLAAVKYRSGEPDRVFEVALRQAFVMGPYEPDVQAMVANYGLAVWSELEPQTRAAVEASVSAGMKRNSLEMLQIAERRGRLNIPCRHLAGSSRQADSKWFQLCQSMEATS